MALSGLSEGEETEQADWAEVLPRALITPSSTEGTTTTTQVDEVPEPDVDQHGRPVSDLVGITTTTVAPAPVPSSSAPPTSSTPTTAAPSPGGPSGEVAAAFASRINGVRTGNGLAPLARDGSLDASALAWAERLAARGSLAHSDLGRFIPPWSSVAENVAAGSSVDGVFSSLAGSGAHLSNMLGDFTHMGVGAWVDGGGTIWTVHVFAR